MRFNAAIRFFTTTLIVLTATLIVYLYMTAISCSATKSPDYIVTNQDILNSKDFHVSSDSTELNTFAIGTIYVKKDASNNYTAQIAAWVDIDPIDWGGVGFYIPVGWKVTKITSSYPNNSTKISMWETAGTDMSYHQRVVIEDSWIRGDRTGGGGNGSVIVELAAYPKRQKLSEILTIEVGVGHEVRYIIDFDYIDPDFHEDIHTIYPDLGKTYILYPDFERIEVPVY